MFIPLLFRGKSPEKTKQYVTEIFTECVVTYRTRRKRLLWVREFLFHKICLHLPLSWFRFFFVSFNLLYTAHPNNFFSEADRRQHISPQETGDFLSLIRQQLQFRYYTDANWRHHFTNRPNDWTKMLVIRTFWRAEFETRPVSWDLWWGDHHINCI